MSDTENNTLVKSISAIMALEYVLAMNNDMSSNHQADGNSQYVERNATMLGSMLGAEELEAEFKRLQETTQETTQAPSSHVMVSILDNILESEEDVINGGHGGLFGNGAQKYEVGLSLLSIADSYYAQRKYALAAGVLYQVCRYLVGHTFKFPHGDFGVACPGYSGLDEQCRFVAMDCCLSLADSFLAQMASLPNCLMWLEEITVIFKNRRYALSEPWRYPDWFLYAGALMPTPTALAFADCLLTQAELFFEIGNSSAYQHNLIMALRCLFTIHPDSIQPGSGRKQMLEGRLQKHRDTANALTIRHPDPNSNTRYKIVDPMLQVQGAWKKLPLTVEKPVGKSTCYPFIWRGYVYAARGRLASGIDKRPDPHTLHRLSLSRLDKWEFVTKWPVVRGEGILNRMCIYNDKMYAFSGHPTMDVLDLVTNKWKSLKTTYKSNTTDRVAGIDPIWPWPKRSCGDTAQHIIGDRLFVFGGLNGRCLVGCNLLMELNLKTLKWRRLSGFPVALEFQDPRLPGPRSGSASWVSKDQKRIYIYSGTCNKQRPIWENKYGPPDRPWMYDDLWSWDIEHGGWREEKLYGNLPAPRASMGYVFSTKLDKLVIFGGGNQTCFSVPGDVSALRSVFYADTFLWNPPLDTSSEHFAKMGYWQQVQTVGFPTYRSHTHLLEDPDTGLIYLYGGNVLGDTVPSKNHTEAQRSKKATYETPMAKTWSAIPELVEALGFGEMAKKSFTCEFEELWRLHVDAPGGDFECIDMEDEIRTATLGPWQRCFQCRQAGFWKKCGGSCDGKAFFCGVDCQGKGWVEHKQFHGCKKRKTSNASDIRIIS